MESFAMAHVNTPVITQNRPLPLRNNCFDPTHTYCPVSTHLLLTLDAIFSTYFTCRRVTVPTLEFDYLYILH